MSSQNRSVSGGVRNLRAMFENKDDAAPPQDRGRSPAGVVGNNSDQNRPVSTVRTSFIAVDRSGQSGLRKEAELNSAIEATTNSSPEGSPPNNNINRHSMSSFSKRRSSFSINEDINPQAVRDRRESIAEEFEARRDSELVSETIPEAAIETPSLEPGAEKQLGAAGPISTRPRPELTKTSTPVQSTPKGRRPSTLETLDGSRPSISNDASVKKAHRGSMAAVDDKADVKSATTNSAKDAEKTAAEQAKAAPKSSLSADSKASPRTSRSPAPPRTPTSPRKVNAKPVTKPTTSSTAEKKPSKPSAASAKITSPPGAKPKSKSPTRPVKLPSSLMAPTAASVKKTASTPPVSMKSEPKSANTTPKSGVQRKPSTLKKDAGSATKPAARRASSKPPTSKPSASEESKESKPKTTTSEGFLARMMRPTAASAQKTHEKPVSPPKRTRSTAKRSVSRNGHRENGSPDARKSKSVSPQKPRKKSVEEAEKQPHEDAVVMEALMNGQPVEEAVEELTVENDAEKAKVETETKKALDKPQIASTKPVPAPVEPSEPQTVDPESTGPQVPPSATGVVPSVADSPLKTEVKADEPSTSTPRKESKLNSKSEDKPSDPFQALKETPSMSAARKGPPSSGEGSAIKPSLLEAFESGSAIADDDEEDLPMPIPHKTSVQEPEEASIPEEATPSEEKSFDKAAVEKEISEQTKAETEKLNAEEVKPAFEQPKVQKPKAVQQLKAEEETVEQLARKDSTVEGSDKENANVEA